MREITLVQKIIFSLPEFFSSIFNSFFSAHLLKFYLESVKYSNTKFALIGSIIGSLDLFIDLFVGHSVDLFGPQFLLLTGAPIVTLSGIFLFLPPNFENEMLLFLYILILKLMKDVFPLNSSYGNLLSRINRIEKKENDNWNLFAIKHIFSLFGGIVGYFIPAFMNLSPAFYILIIGLCSISSYLLLCFVSYSLEFDFKNEKQKDLKYVKLIPGIKKSFKNEAFLSFLYMFLFEAFRGLLWNGLNPLYFTHVLRLKGNDYDFWMGIFHISGLFCATLFTPVWMKIDKKLGSWNTWLLAYALQIPVGILVFCFCNSPQVYLFFFIFLQITGSSSGFLFDTIKSRVFDYDELLTNNRREGSIEASWRFFPRYISLPGSSISFWIVNYFGYQPNINQNENVIQVISILTVLLPSLTSFIVFYFMYSFPIDDRLHQEILEQHEKKSNFNPLRKKKILKSKLKEEHSDTLNHFFNFEIEFHLNRGFVNYEYYFFIFWFSMSILSISYFINQNITIIGHELWKTFLLWISSVLFTFSMFHYNRIEAFDSLKKLDSSQIKEYLKE
eukprot:gene2983-4993_t